MEKKPLEPNYFYEDRRTAPKWKRGVLPAAGIWLLDGAYHVAIHGSPAERRLAEGGALPIAGVRFDGQPMEPQPRDEPHLVALYLNERDQAGSRRSVEKLGAAPGPN